MIDINDLTLGQVREIAGLAGSPCATRAAAPSVAVRAIVVIDRGWIFAGDVTDVGGRVRIDNAVWVFRWEKVGFSGIVADPSKADLRKMDSPVDLPAGAEVFRVPVGESWGE